MRWEPETGFVRFERHLARLRAHGVTCLRLMLEYCQDETCHLESPAGTFRPEMVRLLLSKGANPRLANAKGQTAAAIAD